MKYYKLDRAKSANFWSVRISRDIRQIDHKPDRISVYMWCIRTKNHLNSHKPPNVASKEKISH